MRTQNARSRGGFSLVELLIVIAIISILMAVLLPTLVKTKIAAGRVACMANYRQLLMAISAYASENKGVLPHPNLRGMQEGYPDQPGWLYLHTARGVDYPPLTVEHVKTGVVYKFLKSEKVFRCPLDEQRVGDRAPLPMSYGMSTFSPGREFPVRASRLRKDFIILWEADWAGFNTYLFPDSPPSLRHCKRELNVQRNTMREGDGRDLVLVGCVDQRVEVMPYLDFKKEANAGSNSNNRLWRKRE